MSQSPCTPRHLVTESQEYRERWCTLRAIEWGQWPLFIAQVIAPIALIFLPWESVTASVLAVSWLWCFIRTKFISLYLADIGALIVHLKWIVSIGSAAYLALAAEYKIAVLALLWPFATLLLMSLVPSTPIGVIEALFIRRVLAMSR